MKASTGVRVFELIRYVSRPLDGGIDDWPPEVQDMVMKYLEAKSRVLEIPMAIVDSYSGEDLDGPEDKRWFVHVTVSEVVTGFDLSKETLQ